MPTGYYDFYANQGEELQLNKGHVSSGLGILLYYLCNLSVVIYSNVLKRYYRKYHFTYSTKHFSMVKYYTPPYIKQEIVQDFQHIYIIHIRS